MRCLVVYYSFSGNTRKVAERAARDLNADLAEVRAAHYQTSALRYMRAALDSWRGRLPPIQVSGAALDEHDLVLVMAPVWVGRAATPMRAYLARNRGAFKRVVFLLTCGNDAPTRAFEQMAELAGLVPEATFTLRDREIGADTGLSPALASFLASIIPREAA